MSSGGILLKTNMKKGEAQTKIKKIKNETNVITTTSGEITKFKTRKFNKSNTSFINSRPVIKILIGCTFS